MIKLKKGSRRYKARLREMNEVQLRRRVSPSKNILPWNSAHAIASRVKTTKRNRERVANRQARMLGNDWVDGNGTALPSFVNWDGQSILRGHDRTRRKQVTIAGCAFPTRMGKRPSFGGNPNPKASYYYSLALQGCDKSKTIIKSFCDTIEQFNDNVRFWNHYNDLNNWSRSKHGGKLAKRNR